MLADASTNILVKLSYNFIQAYAEILSASTFADVTLAISKEPRAMPLSIITALRFHFIDILSPCILAA